MGSPSPISTTTLSSSLTTISKRTLLQIRQSTSGIIPTTYGNINDGPALGTVVGIVLGSVGGFLLILWLIYTCMQFGSVSSRSSYTESIVVARERRKSHHGGSTHTRRASETVGVMGGAMRWWLLRSIVRLGGRRVRGLVLRRRR